MTLWNIIFYSKLCSTDRQLYKAEGSHFKDTNHATDMSWWIEGQRQVAGERFQASSRDLRAAEERFPAIATDFLQGRELSESTQKHFCNEITHKSTWWNFRCTISQGYLFTYFSHLSLRSSWLFSLANITSINCCVRVGKSGLFLLLVA